MVHRLSEKLIGKKSEWTMGVVFEGWGCVEDKMKTCCDWCDALAWWLWLL